MHELIEADELAAFASFAISDEAPQMTSTLSKVDASL